MSSCAHVSNMASAVATVFAVRMILPDNLCSRRGFHLPEMLATTISPKRGCAKVSINSKSPCLSPRETLHKSADAELMR